jgi:predicted nucleic acid-binding protein
MSGTPRVEIARVWDACVITDYLAGKPRAEAHARLIVDAARRGEVQIWTSMLAHVEVAFLEGADDAQSERLIVDFLNEDYVFPITVDPSVAEVARKVVRQFRIKGKDAVYVASAIQWRVRTFETFDAQLVTRLRVMATNANWGHLTVREPLYEGQGQLV